MSSISELTKNCSIRNEFLGSNVGRTTHRQLSVTQDHRERQLCQSQAGQTYSYWKRGTVDFSSLLHSYSVYWSRQYLFPPVLEHCWALMDLAWLSLRVFLSAHVRSYSPRHYWGGLRFRFFLVAVIFDPFLAAISLVFLNGFCSNFSLIIFSFFFYYKVAIKIIDKTQLNQGSLQKVSSVVFFFIYIFFLFLVGGGAITYHSHTLIISHVTSHDEWPVLFKINYQ